MPDVELYIDPIQVREARDRVSNLMKDMKVGTSAADALLWFSMMKTRGTSLSNIFTVSVKAAGDASGAREAEVLLHAAAQHFLGQILVKAADIAQAQLKSAEKSRKEQA